MRKTPVTLGVLSIIFGAIIGAMSLFNVLTQQLAKKWSVDLIKGMAAFNQHGPDPTVMMQKMMAAMEPIRPWAYSISGGFTLFSIALCAIGYGLTQRRMWARQASVMWSILGLCFIPFVIYVQVAIIFPISMGMLRDFMPTNKMGGLGDSFIDSIIGMQKAMTVIFTIAFYAPFPVLLAILMGRSSAKNDLLPDSAP